MKKIFISIFILFTINVFSQDPQPHFILEDEIPSSVTKDYIGRDFVKLAIGFHSKPDIFNNHVLAKTDPRLVFLPEEGDLIGGDPNNNEGGVVGTLPGNLIVSPSGAAVYNIPIEVPPGVAGMTPSLGFTYNSMSGDGIVGIGWALSGLSEITRTSTTIYHNGYIDGVDFDENDQFMLDGQLLIPINAEKTEFRTENELFSKIVVKDSDTYGPVWFEVHTKNRKILEFGRTDDSRVNHKTIDGIRKWSLNRIIDFSGNYIDYTYHHHYGYNIPNTISYGKNINSNQNACYEIKLHHTWRYYDPLYWTSGWYHEELRFLINKISITYVETGDIVSSYELLYHDKYYSHLKSVTVEDSDGNKFNPTLFQWGSKNHEVINETALYNYNNRDKLFLDFTGDGKTDMIELYTEIVNNKKKYVGWSCRKRLDAGFSNEITIDANINNYVFSFVKGDYNGDGLEDIVRFIYTNSDMSEMSMDMLLLSNGTGFDSYSMLGISLLESIYPEVKAGDFNGDGIDELLVAFKVFESGGSGINTMIINFPSTYPYYNVIMGTYLDFGNTEEENSQLHLGDFTGDGKMDVMIVSRTSDIDKSTIYEIDMLNKSNSVFHITEGFPTIYHRVYTGDFTGDGITDLLTYYVPNPDIGWDINYFNGKDQWQTIWVIPDLYNVDPFGISGGLDHKYWYSFRLADYNGDGKTDIAQYHLQENREVADYDIFYCSGSDHFDNTSGEINVHGGFVTSGANNIIYNHLNSYNDFNGDGKADEYFYNGLFDDEIYLYDVNNDYNLIKKITNGLGHETEITYSPLTNNDIYTKGSDATYPLRDIQPPINVVTSLDVENGLSGKLTTNYFYTGAKMHMHGKGFLGFKKTVIIRVW